MPIVHDTDSLTYNFGHSHAEPARMLETGDGYIHKAGAALCAAPAAEPVKYPVTISAGLTSYVLRDDTVMVSEQPTAIPVTGVTKTDLLKLGQGGLGELYFRVVAGRPCQIAFGAANKKRIQSISPALPTSLSISSDGYYITGTPLVTGTHYLTVTTDDGSQLALTIEVMPAGLIPR